MITFTQLQQFDIPNLQNLASMKNHYKLKILVTTFYCHNCQSFYIESRNPKNTLKQLFLLFLMVLSLESIRNNQ
jgi:RNase P subunit RPR2